MLGFDAVGRLTPGEVPGGAIEYAVMSTATVVVAAGLARSVLAFRLAGVGAGAVRVAAVARSRAAAVAIAATVLFPVNRVVSAIAGVVAAAAVARGVGKGLEAAGSVGAVLVKGAGKAAVAVLTASGVAVARGIGFSLVAGVAAAGVVTKGIARRLVALVVARAAAVVPEAQNITSLLKLHLPVDYFMEGLPQYRRRGRTYEPGRGVACEDVKVVRGRRVRISGKAPSFTTRTGKRGYD